VSAPPHYNSEYSDQLFKSNLTFCVCVFNLQFEKICVFKKSGSFTIDSTPNVKKKTFYTGYFMSDNEPGGIENATHNTFATLTSMLRLLHSNKTFGRGVVQVAEVFRILGSVKHCSRYPLETRQS
jgi:hypothetical protein